MKSLMAGIPQKSRRYWQRKGLIPDPEDRTLPGRRASRFVERCLLLGMHPARLQRLKDALAGEDRTLHQLSFYGPVERPLTGDLIFREGEILLEADSMQMLFLFDERGKTEIHPIDFSSGASYAESEWHALFADEPTEEVLEQRLHQLLEADPSNLEAWIELGNLHYAGSDMVSAIESYERALAIDSLCAEAHYNLAGCYVQRSEYAAAIRIYHRCIRIRPDFPEALYSLGLLYLSLNYHRPAIQTLRAVVELDSEEYSDSARQFIEDIEQLSLYSGDSTEYDT